MRCYECGGVYRKQHGELMLFDDSIGPYSTHDVSYEKCDKCGDLLFSSSTLQAIEERIDKIRNNYILKEPIGEFISAAETCDILGITRQALHKHRRIRRGFIYSVTIGGVKLYHRKSVELFKNTNPQDGRFPFYEPISIPVASQYDEKQALIGRSGKYGFSSTYSAKSSHASLWGTSVMGMKGVSYDK